MAGPAFGRKSMLQIGIRKINEIYRIVDMLQVQFQVSVIATVCRKMNASAIPVRNDPASTRREILVVEAWGSNRV